jgi:autophagy-related protein 18
MLFSTSLVAVVGSGSKPTSSPRRLRILNTKKRSNICELTFPTAVLSVKLNRKRLVVVLVDQIYIYDISCMKLLHTIETSPNPGALCDLSAHDDSILVYPTPGPTVASPFNTMNNVKDAGSEIGTVVLFDALNIAPLNIVKAHKTELVTLSLNSSGTHLATASNKGTIIRIFSTLTGHKVAQFRRGSYAALIQSIAFDLGSKLVAVASDTGTVHIFQLNTEEVSPSEEDNDEEDDEESILPRSGNSGSVPEPKRQPSIADRVLMNLPKNITAILEPQRDFAFLKVPNNQKKTHTVGFNGKDVLVASSDGSLYVYTIPQKGGECVLVKEYSLE